MTPPQPARIFTVREANSLIGTVEAVVDEIQRLSDEVGERHGLLQVLDVLWGEKVIEPHNPDHQEFRDHKTAIGESAQRIEQLVRDEILARGIRFPVGGLEHGLLDFPTTLDGRVVLLCWQRGERCIEHWHEMDGGFAGRQPVTTEVAERMGR